MDLHDPTTAETVDLLGSCVDLDGRIPIRVESLPQRSLCYRVHFDDGSALFVKRARRNAEDRWTAEIAREGRVLRELDALHVCVPRVLAVLDDDETQLLVMENLSGRMPIDARRAEAGGTDPSWAASFAASLVEVHRHTDADGTHSTLARVNYVSSFVKSWTRIAPSTVAAYAAGYAELAIRMRAGGLLDAMLATIDQWSGNTLLHADIKSDNTLCGADPQTPDACRFIDWELAGWGDPRWDVGCLIGSYLFGWLGGMVFDPGGNLTSWLAGAQPTLSEIRRELRSAITTYTSDHHVVEDDRLQWLRYAGIFLVQRLTVSAIHAPLLSAQALALLQVATQLLQDPVPSLEVLS